MTASQLVLRFILLTLLNLGLVACAPGRVPHSDLPVTPELSAVQAPTRAREAIDTPVPQSSQPPATEAIAQEPLPATSAQPPATTTGPVGTEPYLPTVVAPIYAPLDPALPTPPIPVPAPVQMIEKPAEVKIFALLGNDVDSRQGGRTDSIMLAALNSEAKTLTLLSLPRDLYVVIPGWTMQRINVAYAHGGGDLFKETIAYNLGLPIDHTVRVGFDGFRRIIDALGGIEVVVNCPVEDWRLKAPDLDPEIEENWEPFKLSYGIQEMDGDLALWYARARRKSSDFDRGWRQQKIVRAAAQGLGNSPELVKDLPVLINALWTAVETDLSLQEALELAAIAPRLPDIGIHSLLLPPQALTAWIEPESEAAVQLLDWETAEPVLRDVLVAPALNEARSAPIRVAIITDDYVLYRQAAENLEWYGFEPVYEQPHGGVAPQTTITYYGSALKGSYADRLAWVLRQDPADIQLQDPNPGESVEYRVYLSPTYNPCLNYLDPLS